MRQEWHIDSDDLAGLRGRRHRARDAVVDRNPSGRLRGVPDGPRRPRHGGGPRGRRRSCVGRHRRSCRPRQAPVHAVVTAAARLDLEPAAGARDHVAGGTADRLRLPRQARRGALCHHGAGEPRPARAVDRGTAGVQPVDRPCRSDGDGVTARCRPGGVDASAGGGDRSPAWRGSSSARSRR